MKELFQISDYIRIETGDFEREFASKVLSFTRPSYDFQYWQNHIGSKEAVVFGRWLGGETQQIDSNRLVIECSRELANNTDEKIRMFNFVFGDEGIRRRILPLPKDIYGIIDIDMQIVPGSATYSFSGRTIVINFSTSITIKDDLTQAPAELRRGIILERNSRSKENFSIIHQILKRSNAVEFVYNSRQSRCFAIEKSMDAEVLRRKFELMYESEFEMGPINLLRMAMAFTPKEEFKDLHNFQFYDLDQFQYLGHPRHRFNHTDEDSYFDFQIKPLTNSTQDYASSLIKLNGYLEECETAIAPLVKKIKRIKKHHDPLLGTTFESQAIEDDKTIHFGTYDCSFVAFLSEHNFTLVGESLLNEIRAFHEIIKADYAFVKDELKPFEKSESPLFEYAYRKVTLDPIFYTTGPFQDFAKSLI